MNQTIEGLIHDRLESLERVIDAVMREVDYAKRTLDEAEQRRDRIAREIADLRAALELETAS